MSKIAFAAVCAGVFGCFQSALAADLFTPEPPIISHGPAIWSGFYAGIHLGGSGGDIDVGDTYEYNSPDPFKKSSFETSGIISGIQLGYNFQQGQVVYGIEADIGYLNLSGSGSAHLPPLDNSPRDNLQGSYEASGAILADLTGRIGYATDNALFYVKGGAAFLNANFSADYVGDNCTTVQWCTKDKSKMNPSEFHFEKSETLVGWTLGFGLEYALSSAWSLKAEYQHFNFGSVAFDHNGVDHDFYGDLDSTLKGDVKMSPTIDVVKVGINYQFD